MCFRASPRRQRRSQCRRWTAAFWASTWQQRLTGSTLVTVTTESSDSKDSRCLWLKRTNSTAPLHTNFSNVSLNTIKKNQTSAAVLLLKAESQQYHVINLFFVYLYLGSKFLLHCYTYSKMLGSDTNFKRNCVLHFWFHSWKT